MAKDLHLPADWAPPRDRAFCSALRCSSAGLTLEILAGFCFLTMFIGCVLDSSRLPSVDALRHL
jgi:hypothetical protein